MSGPKCISYTLKTSFRRTVKQEKSQEETLLLTHPGNCSRPWVSFAQPANLNVAVAFHLESLVYITYCHLGLYLDVPVEVHVFIVSHLQQPGDIPSDKGPLDQGNRGCNLILGGQLGLTQHGPPREGETSTPAVLIPRKPPSPHMMMPTPRPSLPM